MIANCINIGHLFLFFIVIFYIYICVYEPIREIFNYIYNGKLDGIIVNKPYNIKNISINIVEQSIIIYIILNIQAFGLIWILEIVFEISACAEIIGWEI